MWSEDILEGGKAFDGEEDVEVGQAVGDTAQARPQVHWVQLSCKELIYSAWPYLPCSVNLLSHGPQAN